MTSVHLLHTGYVGERTASTVVLVRDGDAVIVVDPGMVARRTLITDPLAELGIAPEAVTHVSLSHHHPDHTMNVALFPNAEVVDFWARYRDDLWLDHDGDGYHLAPNTQLWLTPGHSEEDITLVVQADDAVYAMTHLLVPGRPFAGHRSVRLGPGRARERPRADPGRGGHRDPRTRQPVPRARLRSFADAGRNRCGRGGVETATSRSRHDDRRSPA